MRTVSFSDRRVQQLLNNQFVSTFTNTEGDPTAGQSIQHAPRDPAGNCIRGNGKQNVQTIFLTPAGDVFHVATGFLSADDLLEELKFAGQLFEELKSTESAPADVVVAAHQQRLLSEGFSKRDVETADGLDQMMEMVMNSGMDRRNSSPQDAMAGNPFAAMIRSQFLSDNKFSIRNPLMNWQTLETDPARLVGNGKSFFASSSSGGNR